MEKFLLIDKHEGVTSYDIVRDVKRSRKYKKVGHAGTLDPFATGLLVVLVDEGTKLFDEFQKYKKEYITEIVFGKETDTYDKTGKIVFEYDGEIKLTQDELLKEIQKNIGDIIQTPPAHSAVKIKGRRAYDLARKGIEFFMPPRISTVYSAEILDFKNDGVNCVAKVKYVVSSGTYIRSLGYDLGKATKYGAYLSSLRRTAIGEYRVSE